MNDMNVFIVDKIHDSWIQNTSIDRNNPDHIITEDILENILVNQKFYILNIHKDYYMIS